MTESIVLIEGTGVTEASLRISLSNAKQIVLGNAPGFGILLHIAASTPEDMSQALLKFSKVAKVTAVITLVVKTK